MYNPNGIFSIDLSNNLLTYLTFTFFQHMRNLKYMFLQNNLLREIEFSSLSEMFHGLHLHYLNLSHNHLKKIENINFDVESEITLLDVTDNPISELSLLFKMSVDVLNVDTSDLCCWALGNTKCFINGIPWTDVCSIPLTDVNKQLILNGICLCFVILSFVYILYSLHKKNKNILLIRLTNVVCSAVYIILIIVNINEYSNSEWPKQVFSTIHKYDSFCLTKGLIIINAFLVSQTLSTAGKFYKTKILFSIAKRTRQLDRKFILVLSILCFCIILMACFSVVFWEKGAMLTNCLPFILNLSCGNLNNFIFIYLYICLNDLVCFGLAFRTTLWVMSSRAKFNRISFTTVEKKFFSISCLLCMMYIVEIIFGLVIICLCKSFQTIAIQLYSQIYILLCLLCNIYC